MPKGTRPGERELALPPLEAPQPAPPLRLPPPPAPTTEGDRLGAAPRVFVREFRFVGSTVFRDDELARVAEPWSNRELTPADLQAARDALTLHYVNRGYVTSGAVIPDQAVRDGVLEIRLVEGRLAEIEVSGQRRFRSRYFRDRLALAGRAPVNVRSIERRLRIFQQDPRIERVEAELVPALRQGEALLQFDVTEASPYRLALELDNHEAPSIGSRRGHVFAAHENLTGRGDALRLEYGLTSGLDDVRASYEIPVNVWDTALELHVQRSDSAVVEAPFDDLEIESETETYGLRIGHPVYRSPTSVLTLSLTGEYRESRNYLLGERFDFGGALGPSREAVVAVLRIGQDWTRRSETQVLAARSVVSWGLDALGATRNGGAQPDGQFLAWLGQLQWARRVRPLGIELVARADVQLTTSPLLSLEQFAIGGASTVRGYRENEIVRDLGAVASFEARIPLWQTRNGLVRVALAPFVDVGHGWNSRRPTPSPRTLTGVGIGLRGALTRLLHYEVSFAQNLRSRDTPAEHDLQDSGIHFRLYVPIF